MEQPEYVQMTLRVSPRTPSLITKARKTRGLVSNRDYVRRLVLKAVAEDLGLDYEQLVAEQPPTRSPVRQGFRSA